GPRCPSGKFLASGLQGSRLDTRFHRNSALHGTWGTPNNTQWPNALPLVWCGSLKSGRQPKSRPRHLTTTQNY
ncbi:hypothetical protein AVEN_174522-1, partial [Araneus ventricosus]